MTRKTKKSGSNKKWIWAIVVLAAIGAVGNGTKSNSYKKSPQKEPSFPSKSISVQASQDFGNRSKDANNLEEIARDFLSEQFELTLTDFDKSDSKFEITVSIDGITNRDDQTQEPEDWQDIQLKMISAQARTADELGIRSGWTTLRLVDSEGQTMLSVREGRIVENKYKVEEEPEETPKGNVYAPNTQSSGRTVWVTSSGEKYHYSSDCSNMKNPTSMSISDAKAKGYTACSKCA